MGAAVVDNKKYNTMIVNLYAGAGAGKTTCAWIIAAELKKRGIITEYVPEYAKELVWEKRRDLLDGSYKNQFGLLKEQNHRLARLTGQVEVVVTDAPLLLGAMYIKERKPEFEAIALSQYQKYNNFNLFINRGKTYEQAGRVHTLAESREVDRSIKQFLENKNIYYGTYYHKTVPVIVDNIVKRLTAATQKKSLISAVEEKKKDADALNTAAKPPQRGIPKDFIL
jgi:hypothetical protein